MPAPGPEPPAPEFSPSQLIHDRAEAFRRCDFGFIFDSYHRDSNFRRQFPDREEYVQYGWANLGKEFRVHVCRVLREESDQSTARVIFWLEFDLHGERHCYAELAWLEKEGKAWSYRCGQKLAADELPVPQAQLDFCHFDQVADKVLY